MQTNIKQEVKNNLEIINNIISLHIKDLSITTAIKDYFMYEITNAIKLIKPTKFRYKENITKKQKNNYANNLLSCILLIIHDQCNNAFNKLEELITNKQIKIEELQLKDILITTCHICEPLNRIYGVIVLILDHYVSNEALDELVSLMDHNQKLRIADQLDKSFIIESLYIYRDICKGNKHEKELMKFVLDEPIITEIDLCEDYIFCINE